MGTKLRTLYKDGNFDLEKPFTFGIELRQWESKNHIDYVIETFYTTSEKDSNWILYKWYKSIRKKYTINFLSSGNAVRRAVSMYKQLETDYVRCIKSGDKNDT